MSIADKIAALDSTIQFHETKDNQFLELIKVQEAILESWRIKIEARIAKHESNRASNRENINSWKEKRARLLEQQREEQLRAEEEAAAAAAAAATSVVESNAPEATSWTHDFGSGPTDYWRYPDTSRPDTYWILTVDAVWFCVYNEATGFHNKSAYERERFEAQFDVVQESEDESDALTDADGEGAAAAVVEAEAAGEESGEESLGRPGRERRKYRADWSRLTSPLEIMMVYQGNHVYGTLYSEDRISQDLEGQSYLRHSLSNFAKMFIKHLNEKGITDNRSLSVDAWNYINYKDSVTGEWRLLHDKLRYPI